jgi:hypothetical protein
MADGAAAAAGLPIRKLKLGGDDADLARIERVHLAAPKARLLVDAENHGRLIITEKSCRR